MENAVKLVKNTDSDLILYDHHLSRGEKFRERTEKNGKRIETLAERVDVEPAVFRRPGEMSEGL